MRRDGEPVRPGIGYLTASALAASVTDPHRFTSARQFAASLGLTPKADSSAGRDRMGRISKMGDRYLRRLLVIGMTSQLQSARRKPEAHPWITTLLVAKPNKLVAVAMANKAARIAWVIMPSRPGEFHPEPLTEPDVILSHHPAHAIARRLPPSAEQSGSSRHNRLARAQPR